MQNIHTRAGEMTRMRTHGVYNWQEVGMNEPTWHVKGDSRRWGPSWVVTGLIKNGQFSQWGKAERRVSFRKAPDDFTSGGDGQKRLKRPGEIRNAIVRRGGGGITTSQFDRQLGRKSQAFRGRRSLALFRKHRNILRSSPEASSGVLQRPS